MTGAYLHKLTVLSLGRRDLWTKCAQWKCGRSITHRSQDHFIFVALDEQRGGNDDRDIYGIFFLTWVFKHKEDYLFAAHGSFFIACEKTLKDSCMDPCTILLPAYGEKLVYTFIDFHTLTILMQCIASQESKLVKLLHELYWANLHDGGSHLFCGPGKMFYHHMYV